MKSLRLSAAVIIGILLAAVVFAPVPGRTLGIRTLHDFAHGPIFGCVAVLLLLCIRGDGRLQLRPAMQYLLAFFAALALGGLTELAQIPVGRDASWFDLRSDALGAAAFLGIAAAIDGRLRRPVRAFAVLGGVVLLGIHSTPLATAASEYLRRERAFPVLLDFSQQLDSYFLEPQRARIELQAMPSVWARQPGELALRVEFAAGPWPGIDAAEPGPDWRGYKSLVLDVTNTTDADLAFMLRVHDVHHNYEFDDRFNRMLTVAPRTRSVLRVPVVDIESAPRGRSMDLTQIADFMLFRADGSTAPEMWISRVWLE
ncbi:MAG TPA: hypothetical protein VNQ81_16315 [Povalibacter sp.]|nr:hypothetical protein [Povalibacter sp.]